MLNIFSTVVIACCQIKQKNWCEKNYRSYPWPSLKKEKKKIENLEGPILASAVWWPFQLEEPQEAMEEGGTGSDSQHPRSFYATWTSSTAWTWTPGNSHPSAEQLVFDRHPHQMCVSICTGDVFTCMITVVFRKFSVCSRVLSIYISCLAFHCKLGCV